MVEVLGIPFRINQDALGELNSKTKILSKHLSSDTISDYITKSNKGWILYDFFIVYIHRNACIMDFIGFKSIWYYYYKRIIMSIKQKLFKMVLTEAESDMLYDALRNHMDYVSCDEDENEELVLSSLFDKLSVMEEVL